MNNYYCWEVLYCWVQQIKEKIKMLERWIGLEIIAWWLQMNDCMITFYGDHEVTNITKYKLTFHESFFKLLVLHHW